MNKYIEETEEPPRKESSCNEGAGAYAFPSIVEQLQEIAKDIPEQEWIDLENFKMGWIDIKVDPPKNGRKIMVSIKLPSGESDVYHITYNEEYFKAHPDENITHWMPEPKPAMLLRGFEIPVFMPWYKVGTCKVAVGDDFVLTDEEKELKLKYGLADENIAWRRRQMLLNKDSFDIEFPCE